MHYWNQDNFEGLRAIGEKYISMEGFGFFGKYCLQKEQGLNKQAIVSIRAFVADVRSSSQKVQRNMAEELCSLSFGNRAVHQLLAYPLKIFLKEVLTNWTKEEPQNPIPYKWLGYVSRDISFFERAHELDPKDEICIGQIAQAHFNDIDYQTHHLSESLFLGSLKDAQLSLQSAESLITKLSTNKIKSKMQSEFKYYHQLLSCWQKYSRLSSAKSFPEWCAAKGMSFDFWSIVHYDQ